MERLFTILSGLAGLTAVALGAFGAHGLRRRFAELPDAANRYEWWTTAAHYHLAHALAIGLAAWLVARGGGTGARAAGWAFAAGIVLFSGSLYAMALTGARRLGAITPLGGGLFLVGWAAVMVAGWKMSR